jgi:HPt (histidine-containing phosphotransfer) domain-containing protein
LHATAPLIAPQAIASGRLALYDSITHMTPQHTNSTNPAQLPFNVKEAISRCAGNVQLVHEMIEFFFADGPELLVDLDRALHKGNPAEVSRIAHRLRGTVAYLAADRAADAARRVEDVGRSADLSRAGEPVAALQREVQLLMDCLTPYRNGEKPLDGA